MHACGELTTMACLLDCFLSGLSSEDPTMPWASDSKPPVVKERVTTQHQRQNQEIKAGSDHDHDQSETAQGEGATWQGEAKANEQSWMDDDWPIATRNGNPESPSDRYTGSTI